MPAANHPDYGQELERCNYTLEYVEKALDLTLNRKSKADTSLEKTRKHFNGENSQDYIDIIINSQMQGSLEVKLRNLLTARSKPYFARIDFKESEEAKSNKRAEVKLEKLYIGKMCLMREDDQEMIIVDWRAPIANLYYEGRIGEVEYDSPSGLIKGDLLLKRQFSIDHGKLNEIFDIDITTNDEFLQTYLGANADNRLKDIVSTIQVEQNQIVRADMWKPLIVQGAAGSGKTTIALHRIAYLIYTFEKTFTPENFMIIAPNTLFLNYISEVLPELGVERVRQTTFTDFAMDLIGKKLKVTDPHEKLTNFVNKNSTEEEKRINNLVRKSAEFRSSMLFKEILDNYVSVIEKTFIPNYDFNIGRKAIYTYEEINDLFLNQYNMLPIVKRVDEIKKHLTNRLKQQRTEIINQIHMETDKKVIRYKMTISDLEVRQKLIIDALDKRDAVLNKLDATCKTAVKEYVSKISKFSPYEYYKDLLQNEEVWKDLTAGKVEEYDYIRTSALEVLDTGFVELEDLAPIIYLKYLIHGMDEKIPVKHIVIDEAQDFSAFQFYVIRKIIKNSSFTILGDLCQGIHSYRGVKDWQDIQFNVFDDRRCQYLTLEQSYRTTVEIMNAANMVLKNLEDKIDFEAKPVIRHGDPVKVIKMQDMQNIVKDIADKISEYTQNGFKSIAVICKTNDECKDVYNLIKKYNKDVTLISGKEDVYKSGVIIVPSYLSKGLEFDAVLIANANNENYKMDDLDTKLLYVSMTRPLHKLIIYYYGEASNLLKDIN